MFIAFVFQAASASQLYVTLAVFTDKTSYGLRETVEIYGNATHYDNTTKKDELVTAGLAGIQVTDSNLTTIVARTQLLGNNGSQTGVIQIINVTLSDQDGKPRQGVIRGAQAYFRTAVRNTGSLTKTVIIAMNVYDNSSAPIGLGSATTNIDGHGIVDVLQRIDIGQWTKNGTGTVFASVFSDWPEHNGYPYCPEKAATFALWESLYDESPAGNPPQQVIVNGTYDLRFRLSPQPTPGAYVVKISAWHEGFRSFEPATRSFQVVDAAVKPRASFTLNPPKIAPGYQVTFDASSSTAEGYGDTITSYSWDFGDTVHATGKIVTHTYSAVNNYIVKLNVTDNEGFWNTTTRIAEITIEHNSAIIDIQALSQVYNSWNAPITVKAKNRGTVNDSFNVTLKINGTQIGKQLISNLVPYGTKTLNFTWNTTGTLLLHNYTLEAISDTLPGETQTGDNSRTFGPILIRLIGDARFDRRINILDVVAVTAIYGSRSGDPTWDIMSDLAPDGKIDVLDVVKVTSRYGQTY
jgi:hypothetical protein